MARINKNIAIGGAVVWALATAGITGAGHTNESQGRRDVVLAAEHIDVTTAPLSLADAADRDTCRQLKSSNEMARGTLGPWMRCIAFCTQICTNSSNSRECFEGCYSDYCEKLKP